MKWRVLCLVLLSGLAAEGREIHRKLLLAMDEVRAGKPARARVLLAEVRRDPGSSDFGQCLRSCLISHPDRLDQRGIEILAREIWNLERAPLRRQEVLKLVGSLHQQAGTFAKFTEGLQKVAGEGGNKERFRAAFFLAELAEAMLDQRQAGRWLQAAAESPLDDNELWHVLGKARLESIGDRAARSNVLARVLMSEGAAGIDKIKAVYAIDGELSSQLFRYWLRQKPGEWHEDISTLFVQQYKFQSLIAADPVAITQLKLAARESSAHALLLALVLDALGREEEALQYVNGVLAQSPEGLDGPPAADEAKGFPRWGSVVSKVTPDAIRYEACKFLANYHLRPLGELIKEEFARRPKMHPLRKLLWLQDARMDPERFLHVCAVLREKPSAPIPHRLLDGAIWSFGEALGAAMSREHLDMMWAAVRGFLEHHGGQLERYREHLERIFAAYPAPPDLKLPEKPEEEPGEDHVHPLPDNGPLWSGFLLDDPSWEWAQNRLASGTNRGLGTLFISGYRGRLDQIDEKGRIVPGKSETVDEIKNGFARYGNRPWTRSRMGEDGKRIPADPDGGIRLLERHLQDRPDDIHLKLILAQHLMEWRNRPREIPAAIFEDELRARANRALELLEKLPAQIGARQVMVAHLKVIAARKTENRERTAVLEQELAKWLPSEEQVAQASWKPEVLPGVMAAVSRARKVLRDHNRWSGYRDPRYLKISEEQALEIWSKPLDLVSSKAVTLVHQRALFVLDQKGRLAELIKKLQAQREEAADPDELTLRIYHAASGMRRSRRGPEHSQMVKRERLRLVESGLLEAELTLPDLEAMIREQKVAEAVRLVLRSIDFDPARVFRNYQYQWFNLLSNQATDEQFVTTARLCLREARKAFSTPRTINDRSAKGIGYLKEFADELDKRFLDDELALSLRVTALAQKGRYGRASTPRQRDVRHLHGKVSKEQAMLLARYLLLPIPDPFMPIRHVRSGGDNWVWHQEQDSPSETSAGYALLMLVDEAGAIEDYWKEEQKWQSGYRNLSLAPFLAGLLAGAEPWNLPGADRIPIPEGLQGAMLKLDLSEERRDGLRKFFEERKKAAKAEETKEN